MVHLKAALRLAMQGCRPMPQSGHDCGYGNRALMRMTHADWIYFAKFIIAALAIFYLNVWFWESSLAGSWRAGHARLWKKPKKWQLITFCVLWGLILIAFIIAFSIRRSI